ncbi:MAG: CoA transferase [Alphaproteobacteria bacterium]|nr:CoA transferase [Alphaproteobacteria bacterium]
MAPLRYPLEGVRVIAVESYGAGPFGSMQLGDLGAEVIKVENPAEGGDDGRKVGPFFDKAGESYFFHGLNRNKRSITLNLRTPEGQEVLRRLVRTADATYDNLRGDLPEKFGLTYDVLKTVNPKIVCTHLSAYGRDGSRKGWPGYDYLMQAETGYLSVTGEPDGPPVRMGLSLVDLMGGINAAYVLVAGVLEARATGAGRDLDVSLFDTALSNLGYLASWYLNAGHVQGRLRRGAHPSLGPTGLFRTKDGWIMLMMQKERFWPRFCALIEREDLVDHPDYKDMPARHRNRERMFDMLDEILSARTTDEWIARLSGKIPCAPVYDIRQALENPFVHERGRVFEQASNHGDPVRMVAPAFTVTGQPHLGKAAPALGADTGTILGELGFDAAAQADLRGKGVI